MSNIPNKKELDNKLKNDSAANGFRIEADYIIFDKSANLDYVPIKFFTLRHLLTKNPVSSYTKLSKTLLLRVHLLADQWSLGNTLKYNQLTINSSYRSPEYNKTVPGSSPTSQHCLGNAIDIGTKDVQGLFDIYDTSKYTGGCGVYDWGIHIDIGSGTVNHWDKRSDQTKARKIKDFLLPDTRRNWLMIGVLAVFGFFIVKRIF